MRRPLVVAVLSLIPLSAGCGAYFATGASVLPYQGEALHPAAEYQLGISRPEFPHWAIALSGTSVSGTHDSASFVEPTCYNGTAAEFHAHQEAGCHPKISAYSSALEVQYRWRTTRTVRPVAALGFGQLQTSYSYRTVESFQKDSTQASQFLTVRGGGEVSVSSWAHVGVLAGYREAFRKTSLHKTVSNSGLTAALMLIIGRRYKAP